MQTVIYNQTLEYHSSVWMDSWKWTEIWKKPPTQKTEAINKQNEKSNLIKRSQHRKTSKEVQKNLITGYLKKKNKEARNKKKLVEINNSRNKNNSVKDEKLSWRNPQSRTKRKTDGQHAGKKMR